MRTAKTGKIMSLVGGDEKEATHNPNLRIPDGSEIPVIYTKNTPAFQLVNVGFLLINEQLGQVMERFNCCMCEKCISAVTSEALRHIPQLTVEVRRKSDEERVNILAAANRSEVTKILTKEVIRVKNYPRHK